MALNLSTLTSSATSGDVLAEALTTADFLENVPVLRNLARGSQKGGDAKQDVALNQPKALPLIKNPAGDLGGYLYIPDVGGNYAEGPSVTIGANETWEAEVDMVITQISNYIKPFGGGVWTSGFGLAIRDNGGAYVWSKTIIGDSSNLGITLGTCFNIKYGFDGTQLFVEKDGTRQNLITPSSQVATTSVLQLNQQTLDHSGNYAIQKAKLTVNNAVVFDCDFNGSTSIRHGDTKFNCVGGPVSLIRAGQDPLTVVKKDILRFDGVNDGLQGLFANNINSGCMFAAFSVLGDGGESYGRVFSTSLSTSGNDYAGAGAAFSIRNSDTANLSTIASAGTVNIQYGMFDDSNRDILHVVKIENELQTAKVNNASFLSSNRTTAINSDEFNIGFENNTGSSACIDLEFLAVFPASITDAQADDVGEYIRGKTQVYDLPTPIKNDYSVAFDGIDDYMNTTLPVLGNTHTLSAWFKTTASYGGAGSEGTLISYISIGGGGDDSVLSVITNKVGWSDFVDDNQFGTSTVNYGNWHHAVAVVTATTQKIFVDGVLETTTSNAYSAGTSFSHFALGRRANAPQRFFNGNIDEVAIWNSELSATDVTAIYNGGRPVNLNANTNGYDNSSTLVAWWRMGDDGLGNAVPDQTNLTVGSDVVVNGDFSSSSGWNLGGSDTITGGKLVLVNSGGLRYRSLDLVDGQVYECKVTVSNYTSGSFRFYLNGGQGTNIASNGEHIQYITAGTANNLFGFNPAAASASLDNFSVTPINGYAGSLHNCPTFQTNTP